MRKNRVTQLHDMRGEVFAEYKYNNECFSNFAKHSHQTLNIIAIGSGMIEIEYHAQPTQKLHSDQLAIFNPLQVHMTKKQTAGMIAYHSLHLEADWCMNIQEEIFGNLDALLPVTPNILSDVEQYQNFMTIVDLISEKQTDSIEPLINAYIRDMFEDQCQQTKQGVYEDSLLQNIESYIIEHLDSTLTLEDIAAEAGYSSAHINRLFKKQYGLTLHAFLLDKKVQKAKILIQNNTDVTLTDIAYEAGFYDQSHFIKAFKKAYSLSPNAYKNIRI